MKRGAVGSSGKKSKKPRAKDSEATALSGDYELDLNKFPDKLRYLLDRETAPEALWWLPEGDAIGISKSAFQEQLLVQEFRGNKFSSITRKLNRWGFRRVDDEERVPEGAIAYSHDFFLKDSVSMMRFMKKEEDRKQDEAEEDAKSNEDARTSSLRTLLGEGQPQGIDLSQTSSLLGLGQVPSLGLTALETQAGLLQAPTAPFPSSLTLQQLQARSLLPADQVLQGNAASLAALTSSQIPSLQPSAATGLSLRNQLAMSMRHQQQLLLEERHQQFLLQERQQQLRRLSAVTGANLPLNPSHAALMRRGSHLDSALRSLPSQTLSPDVPSNPLLAAAASPSQHSDLLRSRLLTANLDGTNLGLPLGTTTAGTGAAASLLPRPEVASLEPNPNLNNRMLLLQQQHEQIEQERLLQLRQQLLTQPGAAALASQQPPTAGNLRLSNQMYGLAQAEAKEEEQKQPERQS